MTDIVLVGGGGHAKIVASLLKKSGKFNVLGYVDKNNNGPLLDLKYLGTDDVLIDLVKKHKNLSAAIGIGNTKISTLRQDIFNKLKEIKLGLPAIVSPQAIINEEVIIGEGTVICDGAVVQSGTRIGVAAILNTRSSVDHDCQIGDFVHIAPGAILSGGVRVGNHSLLGTGCSVIQNIKIGDHCIIGSGAAVVKDCLIPGTYVGVPAEKL